MTEFLGDYSFEKGLSRVRELISDISVLVAPTEELKRKLQTAINLPTVKIVREFEAALSFFEGNYPVLLVREIFCLRIIRSKEGSIAAKSIFPHRSIGISEARTLLKLFDELFLLGQSAAPIFSELTRLHHPEAERWGLLATLESLYRKELSGAGFKFERVKRKQKVILFGLLKLSNLFRSVLSDSEVVPLVFDESGNSNLYNQYGEVVSSAGVVELPALEFVQTPRDYLSSTENNIVSSASGILLFDEYEKRVLTQQLIEKGHSVETIEPSAVRYIGAVVNTVLKSLNSQRLFDLFSVLRITAVEEFVSKSISTLPEGGLLSSVDEYQADRLQLSWTANTLPEGENLATVKETLELLKKTFIAPTKAAKSLKDTAQLIISWINNLYPDEAELLKLLSELEILSPPDPLEIEECFRLALSFLSNRLDVKLKPGDLKIFDTLESAYYSENRNLILLGPVSGRIPKNTSTSIFLNSGILKLLEIEKEDGSGQRFLLKRLAPFIKSIVIPRQTLSGDQTAISPLLFRAEAKEIASQVLQFFDVSDQSEQRLNTRTEVIHALPPRDLSSLRNLDGAIQLSVTALDFYSASPFKFYLERILKASRLTDEKRELEANQFGDLAHAVLKSVLRFSKNSSLEEIKLVFKNELNKIAEKLYGTNLSAAVETQFFNLTERLKAYARYEMRFLHEGWETIYCEQSSKPFTLEIPKENIVLTARVDRIDYNRQFKSYRIWDYKTGDNSKSIFKRDSSIASLQLPLYAYFLKQGLFGEYNPEASIEAGYIALGSIVSEPKAFLILESHLDEALSLAKAAANNLLSCRFERGEFEKIPSSSDFSMFQDYLGVDFGEAEA